MGVELPRIPGQSPPPRPEYGLGETCSELDECYLKFHKVKELTRRLAEVETSIYRLADAIKKTQKRANALENIVIPGLDEEIFRRDRYKTGQHWHTIEGACYFREGDWQYVMYSGNCYLQPTYYIGYARAKTNETDLTKIKFEKVPDDHTYAPVIRANDWEEGTGHHSVIKKDGVWYAVYHARNVEDDGFEGDRRNARICRLEVKDGTITAHRYPDHI